MPNPADLDPLLFQKLKEEIVPLLLDSGSDAITVYEVGRSPEGDLNYTNYRVGCAFWEGSFRRVARLCRSGKSFVKCRIYSNILELSASISGQYIRFFMARVDKNTRRPRSAKGIKKLLRSPITQNQCFLSEQLKQSAVSQGEYTIGVDLDEDNGIGKITFDILVPAGARSCQALTVATLYDSEEEPLAAPVPEAPRKPKVHRDAAQHLAKTELRDTKSPPEQIEKKQAIRQGVEQPAQAAKK